VNGSGDIVREVESRLGSAAVAARETPRDGVATFWTPAARVGEVLADLKTAAGGPYRMLYDLTAIDERVREHRTNVPAGDFTVVYQLYSFDRNEYVRVKVALGGEQPEIATVTGLWPAANWYERELWDMFGIAVAGHPHLRRILMPPWWTGHPLRKDHPARATEMAEFHLPAEAEAAQAAALEARPEEWGLAAGQPGRELQILNLGPHHPGTHGLLRIVLQLEGEEIVAAVPDIGFHHRGAEKMGERQSWHSYIPYTDRIDYLGGVLNEFPYVLAVEKLAGIAVPQRAAVIRVMMAELFRIASHLVWYGTFAADLGAMSPVFYMFTDREKLFEIVEAVTGGRMHPGWFRIGGVAADLPRGWEKMVREFLDYLPARLKEYETLVMKSLIVKRRTRGVGRLAAAEAVEWGVTGPNLRACGLEWDFRRKQPYGGYENFEFEIPTAAGGDCYARAEVRVAEIRQSLRIVEQCLKNMPAGEYMSDHPLATPPRKARTRQDIETLITHFLGVSWGPVIPPGEAFVGAEGAKGNNGYYLVSDGSTMSYRTRIRTPSFAHLQTVPALCRGQTVADLIAILGSLDYVLADVDR
jgi:NADH-quinone oxidoreductase subunit C/D